MISKRKEATREPFRPPVPAWQAGDGGGSRFSARLKRLRREMALRAMAPFCSLQGSRREVAFGILMYHRVVEPAVGVEPPTFNVTPSRFREQLQGLLDRGYRPWPLRKVLAMNRAGGDIPRNTFVVTFDDGYENVYRNAWPVLKALEIPATVFLATAYLDDREPFPFDDWSAAGCERVPPEAWRPLSTAQCREMQEQGLVELGCHTHSHADFRNRPEALREDVVESLRVLQRQFGLADATFAFPYGVKHLGFSGPLLAAAVKEAGTLCALTTESETIKHESDPFDWGRFSADETDTAQMLAVKLAGWYGLARHLWRKLRRPRANGAMPETWAVK